MFALIHPKCGKPAWLMVVAVCPSDVVDVDNFRELDLSPFKLERFAWTCRSCGGVMSGLMTTEDIAPYSPLRAAAIAARRAGEVAA